MSRLLLLFTALLLVGGVAAFSYQRESAPGFVFKTEKVNPVSRLDFPDAKTDFSFAIVSDRTGTHRPNVFAQAVEKLNLMQPQFVVTVGDLIEGGGAEKVTVDQWKEFDSYVGKLQMPFFYLTGNHDRRPGAGQRIWDAKLGRHYYRFVYRNTLFLMLSTEDLPGKIGKEQIQWAQKTLADNAKVRWTMVFVHRPLWDEPGVADSGFLEVEKALAGRKYTVFCGHIHSFKKFVRQGMNHYQLATTGGGSLMRGVRFGEFDHFTWVTMKEPEPVISHVLLQSVLTENLAPIKTFEPGFEW